MNRADVTASYTAGVTAVAQMASQIDADGWDTPCCGTWTAADVARHVAGVADWYHDWLDRAVAGATTPAFPADQIDLETQREVDARASIPGPEAVTQFVDRALSYADRVADAWELRYAYPFGIVTAGEHFGLAAAEWHLHAWDLSAATPERYRPGDASQLFKSAGMGVAAATGGLAGKATALIVPLAARIRPWEQLLRRSGRQS